MAPMAFMVTPQQQVLILMKRGFPEWEGHHITSVKSGAVWRTRLSMHFKMCPFLGTLKCGCLDGLGLCKAAVQYTIVHVLSFC